MATERRLVASTEIMSDGFLNLVPRFDSWRGYQRSRVMPLSNSKQSHDPVRKGRLRTAADAVAGIGRDVLVSVLSAAATGALPHH